MYIWQKAVFFQKKSGKKSEKKHVSVKKNKLCFFLTLFFSCFFWVKKKFLLGKELEKKNLFFFLKKTKTKRLINVGKIHWKKNTFFCKFFFKKNYIFTYIPNDLLLIFFHFFDQKKYQKNIPKLQLCKNTKTHFSQIFFFTCLIFWHFFLDTFFTLLTSKKRSKMGHFSQI